MRLINIGHISGRFTPLCGGVPSGGDPAEPGGPRLQLVPAPAGARRAGGAGPLVPGGDHGREPVGAGAAPAAGPVSGAGPVRRPPGELAAPLPGRAAAPDRRRAAAAGPGHRAAPAPALPAGQTAAEASHIWPANQAAFIDIVCNFM